VRAFGAVERTIEDESDHEESERLRESVERIRVDECFLRSLERDVQRPRVGVHGVLLPSERRDGSNRSRCFASQLSGSLVICLVLLILQDDQSKSKVTGGDDEGNACDSDQGEFPAVDQTDWREKVVRFSRATRRRFSAGLTDGSSYDGSDGLENRSQGDTGKSLDLG